MAGSYEPTGTEIFARGAAVADIPTPASATAEDCADKINELLAVLRNGNNIAG